MTHTFLFCWTVTRAQQILVFFLITLNLLAQKIQVNPQDVKSHCVASIVCFTVIMMYQRSKFTWVSHKFDYDVSKVKVYL